MDLNSLGLSFHQMQRGHEQAVAELIEHTFMAAVAPGYPPEGVQTFLRYAAPGALLRRSEGPKHRTLVAVDGDRVIGVVELRDGRHISLMFVDPLYQGRGLGRQLLQRVLCERQETQVVEITVNASPNAVSAYRRMGFRPTEPQRERDGILYVPMVVPLLDVSGCGPL